MRETFSELKMPNKKIETNKFNSFEEIQKNNIVLYKDGTFEYLFFIKDIIKNKFCVKYLYSHGKTKLKFNYWDFSNFHLKYFQKINYECRSCQDIETCIHFLSDCRENNLINYD